MIKSHFVLEKLYTVNYVKKKNEKSYTNLGLKIIIIAGSHAVRIERLSSGRYVAVPAAPQIK